MRPIRVGLDGQAEHPMHFAPLLEREVGDLFGADPLVVSFSRSSTSCSRPDSLRPRCTAC